MHSYCLPATPSWHDVLAALPALTECTATQCTAPLPHHEPELTPFVFLLPLLVLSWLALPHGACE